MAGLVVGDPVAVLAGEDPRASLRTGHLALDGLGELAWPDAGAVAPGCQQGRLVYHVRQVGAREAGCSAGHEAQVDIGLEGLSPCVDGQDALAPPDVGSVERDPPVESSWSQ